MYWSQDGLIFCFDVLSNDFTSLVFATTFAASKSLHVCAWPKSSQGSALAPFCHAVQRGFVEGQQVVANLKVNGFSSSLRQEMMCLVEKMKSRSCVGRLATRQQSAVVASCLANSKLCIDLITGTIAAIVEKVSFHLIELRK